MKNAFRKAEDGNVAIIFACALVPILALAGAAIDYSRAAQAKARLRNAVDAAAMVAASAAAADRDATGGNFLASNLQNSGIAVLSSSFTPNSDGTLTVAASGQIPSYISGIVGVKQIGVQASATVGNVALPPKELTFNAINASGAYWKQVDLIVKATDNSPETTLASYVYQPTNQNTYTGTLTASYNNGSGAMVAGPNTKKLTLPANYVNLYLKMTAYTDGCGPGQVPQHGGATNPWVCVKAGSAYTVQTTTMQRQCTGSGKNQVCQNVPVTTTSTAYEAQKSGSPIIFTTNPKDSASAASSHNLFVQDLNDADVADNVLRSGKLIKNVSINNGVTTKTYKMAMMPNNITPSIFDILPCPTPADGVMQQWEDTTWTSNLNTLPGSWATQDFTFNVNTNSTTSQGSCAPNPNYNGTVAQTSTGVISATNRNRYLQD